MASAFLHSYIKHEIAICFSDSVYTVYTIYIVCCIMYRVPHRVTKLLRVYYILVSVEEPFEPVPKSFEHSFAMDL
jgi:hypothetical protein